MSEMIGRGRERTIGTSLTASESLKAKDLKSELECELLTEPSSISKLTPSQSYVILSGRHDYRSKRKVDLHFIADELKKQGGAISFISLHCGYLARHREDPRRHLSNCANRTEIVDGVRCFLWRTPLHPFSLPNRLSALERLLFSAFSSHLNQQIRTTIQNADVALVESGLPIIYIPLMKRLNPRLRIIYMASDPLDGIGQAKAVKHALKANAPLIDRARVPSPYLAIDVPPRVPCCYIPHGMDSAQLTVIGTSPFSPGSRNAVSAGSVLFDPAFFGMAAAMFPDIIFHVIGSGYKGFAPPNVRYYPEMPLAATLRHIKHGSFAIASYPKDVQPHLTHTSAELMQYNYLGVPVVCPKAVAGVGLGRFGYEAGDASTIRKAIENAIQGCHFNRQKHLEWGEVTKLLLDKGRTKAVDDTDREDRNGVCGPMRA